jgi:transcriptional regulator with XRE-family HTH domain
MNIGLMLKNARQAQGLSLDAIAERMGTTRGQVIALEKEDKTGYTVKSLSAYASALGLQLKITLEKGRK